MKIIIVIKTTCVGLVMGACLTDLGNEVQCLNEAMGMSGMSEI